MPLPNSLTPLTDSAVSRVTSMNSYNPSFDTPLGELEPMYRAWKNEQAPTDTGDNYDYRGAFMDELMGGGQRDALTGHWSDQYKKPNYPTFSTESQYSGAYPERAGKWEGDTYIPPPAPPGVGLGWPDTPPVRPDLYSKALAPLIKDLREGTQTDPESLAEVREHPGSLKSISKYLNWAATAIMMSEGMGPKGGAPRIPASPKVPQPGLKVPDTAPRYEGPPDPVMKEYMEEHYPDAKSWDDVFKQIEQKQSKDLLKQLEPTPSEWEKAAKDMQKAADEGGKPPLKVHDPEGFHNWSAEDQALWKKLNENPSEPGAREAREKLYWENREGSPEWLDKHKPGWQDKWKGKAGDQKMQDLIKGLEDMAGGKMPPEEVGPVDWNWYEPKGGMGFGKAKGDFLGEEPPSIWGDQNQKDSWWQQQENLHERFHWKPPPGEELPPPPNPFAYNTQKDNMWWREPV